MSDVSVEMDHRGNEVVITLNGEIDLSNAETVGERINTAITNTTTCVSLDLTDIAYIDSAGMRIVFELAVRLQTLQTDFIVVAPHGSRSRQVLELSGLSGVARLEPPAPPG